MDVTRATQDICSHLYVSQQEAQTIHAEQSGKPYPFDGLRLHSQAAEHRPREMGEVPTEADMVRLT